MLKIRLMRIGAKKRPFYRVVAVDERNKRTGAYIELLGTYNPLTTPHDIKLKQDRIDHWIKQGAQPSDGFLRMIGKAPQRPPRKPKKEKKVKEPKAPEAAPAEETPAEETAKSETVDERESESSVENDGSSESGPASPEETKQSLPSEAEGQDQTNEGAPEEPASAEESEKKDEGSA